MKDSFNEILENYSKIRENIEKACQRAGRSFSEVKILGASKKQSTEKIKIAYELGIKVFGENYVQEAEEKIKKLENLDIEWHFIGRLQTNKVKKALKLFSVIQTLDRINLAQELQKQAEKLDSLVSVFIEINIGEEPTKAGVGKADLEKFLEEILNYKRIRIRGLMCLPPYTENPENSRQFFKEMRKLWEKFKPYLGEDFTELSMGTSNDYVVAVEEGATLVRIGEALFGRRV